MGGSLRDVSVFDVPGAFELPLAARAAALSGRFDAVVALGAVIQGDTDHYEHVAREAASGLAAVARETGVPVAFGVLTVREARQAEERAQPGPGNKGAEAARAAVMLVRALREIEGGGATARAHGPRVGRAAARGDAPAEGLMGRRTKARECAFQILYQWEISGEPIEPRDGPLLAGALGHAADAGDGRAAGRRRAGSRRGARRGDRRGRGQLAARPDRAGRPDDPAPRRLRAGRRSRRRPRRSSSTRRSSSRSASARPTRRRS